MARGAEALTYRPQIAEVAKNREAEANQFGAFMQVFVKQKDEHGIAHITCLSYPLSLGIGNDQAGEMMRGILGPNQSSLSQFDDYYKSKSGELQFRAREGVSFDGQMLSRFLDVPGSELGIDQTVRKTELLGGVLNEFRAGLGGKRHESAQASQGENIFAFSYRVDPEKQAIYGKDVKGKEGRRLSELAMEGDEEHKLMLEALEQKLLDMEEGVLLNFDKSKTVSLCCALFFKNKLVNGIKSAKSAVEKALDKMSSLFFGPKLALSHTEDGRCKTCGEDRQECNCAVQESDAAE